MIIVYQLYLGAFLIGTYLQHGLQYTAIAMTYIAMALTILITIYKIITGVDK